MNEIAKQQKCILLRNGIEIRINEDVAENIKKDLCNNSNIQFIEIVGELLSVRSIDGIFNVSTITDMRRRKQGLREDTKEKLNL